MPMPYAQKLHAQKLHPLVGGVFHSFLISLPVKTFQKGDDIKYTKDKHRELLGYSL